MNMRQMLRKKTLAILVLVAASFTTIFVFTNFPQNPKVLPTKARGAKKQEEYVDRRGIRVIVGHYKPDDGPGINFTKEELNIVNFHPEDGAGEQGRPVYLKPHEQINSKRLFHINEFNLVASDKISPVSYTHLRAHET